MFSTSTQFNSTTIPRFARHTKRNGAVNYVSKNGPLELDHLLSLAPSIGATQKHEKRSEKYSYIPTSEIVRALGNEGFRPYSVMQGGSRDEGKRAFTKHLIRFRHRSSDVALGTHHNEICLLNSHDGTSAYRLFSGVFRLVCANGLVVSDSNITEVRVPHKGDVVDKVVNGCVEVLQSLPEINENIARFSSLQLSSGEQKAFAHAALIAKYGEKEAPIRPSDVLRTHRAADREANAWSTMNVVQENLVRGGVHYVDRSKKTGRVSHRRTRATNSVDGNVSINRALWALTNEMAKLKGAA